jgi:hypothetical protein
MGFFSIIKYTFIIFAAHLATSCASPFEDQWSRLSLRSTRLSSYRLSWERIFVVILSPSRQMAGHYFGLATTASFQILSSSRIIVLLDAARSKYWLRHNVSQDLNQGPHESKSREFVTSGLSYSVNIAIMKRPVFQLQKCVEIWIVWSDWQRI